MRKWLNWVALVIAFSIACGFLANWQFDRRATKIAAIELVKKNYFDSPVPLSQLEHDGEFDLNKDVWRVVTLRGQYLPENTLLARNRPNNGQPGFEELVPFQGEGFGLIYVSRGWLPTGQRQDKPDEIPLPSQTTTTITAHLVSAEPILDRGAPAGQIASINPSLADSINGLKTDSKKAYLRLVSESPSTSSTLTPMPQPATEEGNNLSYALQWILFALMAVIALVWRIHKDRVVGVKPKTNVRQSDLDASYEDSATTTK